MNLLTSSQSFCQATLIPNRSPIQNGDKWNGRRTWKTESFISNLKFLPEKLDQKSISWNFVGVKFTLQQNFKAKFSPKKFYEIHSMPISVELTLLGSRMAWLFFYIGLRGVDFWSEISRDHCNLPSYKWSNSNNNQETSIFNMGRRRKRLKYPSEESNLRPCAPKKWLGEYL